MKIRTALVRGFAAILAVTGFAGVAFATDNFGNCTAVGAGELDCSANHYGDLLINHWGDQSIFNLFEFSKDQTATLKNTGNVEYDVLIEQGARTVYQGTVRPGATINIAPLDNGYFSWTEYSVIISNPDGKPYLTPNAKARIHVIAFTPVHNQCNDRCTISWNGCHQGCALDPHITAVCSAGCDFAYNTCLTNCSHQGN